MLVEQFANRLKTNPEQLERESLRFYLNHQLRVIETELFALARRYGVKTVFELDKAIQDGKFNETQAFEEYFRFDSLEDERDTLRGLLEQL
jgi:hypothetical protein